MKIAIILAAGSGTRAGGDVPKQFQTVGSMPMVWHSIAAFLKSDPNTRIVVVLSPGGRVLWSGVVETAARKNACVAPEKIFFVEGGDQRVDSVSNALRHIKEIIGEDASGEEVLIAVHDAARPLVDSKLISRGWETAALNGTAVPVVPVTDSLRKILKGNPGSKAVDRSQYFAVQTPQIFKARLLFEAYDKRRKDKIYTDDASVVEELQPVELFEGDPVNFKVTGPNDFVIANALFDL